MQPLRIRSYLLDGRVVGVQWPFPLDSILAAEWMRRNHPAEYYGPPPPNAAGWIEPDLSGVLDRRGEGDRWWYACSFNQTPPVTEYTHHWHRRFDDQMERYINFGKRRGKVDSSSGKYRAYRMPMNVYLFAEPLTWYAVGDADSIRDLLTGVVAIGKKPSQGFGLIDRWEVEPWPEDWSEVGPGGKLMRAMYELPAGCTGARVRLNGMRPPYWRKPEAVYVP